MKYGSEKQANKVREKGFLGKMVAVIFDRK